ncbi:DUF2840 domain-containing protein [Hoeflea poritis]|uniref:DUF2840 domain-containing protein n=1 Tax=Hoeflea poritis TaxID=2993659 RepID=A0ABT4VXZ3_9HYPH|nr:DUF2840 domain-containing protein [Hoeflea poritis]MDA4848887.1 DUF2840 domain-containing protein [Hoeflea poritis]
MSKFFTSVEIAFYPEYINCWLRFGKPDAKHNLDRRRSLVLFGPAQVFGYVRWRANEYGMQNWSIAIARARAPLQVLTRLEGIHPGADILLLTTGKARVKRVLAQLDKLEAAGFEPAEISPAYHRHIHNRILTSRSVKPYSDEQHDAFLAARALGA